MKNKHAIFLPILTASLLLAGCESNNSNPISDGSDQSTMTGRMETNGAASKAAAGSVQNVVVTAFAINTDGSQGLQMAIDTTDAQGNFQFITSAQGNQNWLLVSTQGTLQWMGRFNGTLTLGVTDTARPINLESTLLTQVYLDLQKTTLGRSVTSGEITATMDANVAASNRTQYESGDATLRAAMITHFSAAIIAQSQARSAYLSHANVQYSADTASAAAFSRQAEKSLNVALYKADEDSIQTRLVEKAYMQALITAYVKSDSSAMSYARSAEAAYHATLATTTLYVDSTKNSMRRRADQILAIASDTAIQREFRRANASSFQSQAIVTAGVTFQSSVDTARTDVSRDSVISRYRTAVRAVFQGQGAVSDSAFITMLNLSTTAPLSNSLHTLSTSLQTALAADMTGINATGTGIDLQNYNAQGVNAILLQWQGNSHNSGNVNYNSAMAQIMAFLSVSSNSSHNGM